MILLDDRGGAKGRADKDYYPGRLKSMIPNSELTRLETGDVAFLGVNNLTIGIELKKVTDALSCIYSSRLADTQLPKMAEAYDVRYLIIEEPYRAEPTTGVLQRWKAFPSQKEVQCGRWYDAHGGRNRVMYSTFELWLHTMSELGGARLERSNGIEETASLITTLHTWWNREDHRSFNVMQEVQGSAAALSRPAMLRRMLALLPRVGWERSAELSRRFHSVREMVEAKPEAWLIPNEIAIPTALKIVEALNGTNAEG
jgi:ERCC4-type nuclease